jgi:hypothetical protein
MGTCLSSTKGRFLTSEAVGNDIILGVVAMAESGLTPLLSPRAPIAAASSRS